jgi:uncharacterized protein YndB with AHSA1/START domain
MQTTVSTRITIAASPSKIFDFLTDLKNHYLWNPQIRKISQQGKIQLGSTYRTESQVLNVKVIANNIVTECKPPTSLVLENSIGVVSYVSRMRLAKKEKGTVVTFSVTLSTKHSTWAFTLPALKQLALRELRTDLQALKVAVENEIKPSS